MTHTAFAPFHVMVKPIGAICNLDCEYCYYLSKRDLYRGHSFRMATATLERYVRQLIESQPAGEVTLAWQGGEPTLLGLEFFQQAVTLAERYRRSDQHIVHTLQTNGTRLTDDWARFLKEHDFLVGISIDGPPPLHDAYRVDKHGRPTSTQVLAGLATLQKRAVAINGLCTVHAGNVEHALEVYRFLRDECQISFMQFIPIVEPIDTPPYVSSRTVNPKLWGQFLIAVFDEWVQRDVGSVFVQIFEAALSAWLGLPHGLCIFSETCGRALALEHNGDVYSCDHFVDAEHRLGNLNNTTLVQLLDSPQQKQFGNDKQERLANQCRSCDVLFACRGECPKNRFARGPSDDPDLNYLCSGYQDFFHHINGPMSQLANLIRHGRSASEILKLEFRR
ncbi:MAG: anaerobic sulfatase maturase [Sulfobacillus acidophilus]|uniref:Anaerobic sulfatase maturase n=1 Tax=Sulfobacillus acidophilus TaxID=53633 RepID=A0A2T2WJT5_9FIRM|nr:MAG: anaerobic sulfatase maturase [Sulfobacillus acidophilus]